MFIDKKMQNVVIVVSLNEADFLRASLPRSRRAMPDAKFIVVTSVDDEETKSIAAALRVQVVTLPKQELSKNSAVFNFSAFARAGQLAAQAGSKIPFWMIVTRPHVVIDASLSNLPFLSLERDAVYGCSVMPIKTGADLVKYVVQEPSAGEVRLLSPTETFLMTHSTAPLFPVWSQDTASATDLFLTNFVSKYMIQKKLAFLGDLYRDVRTSSKWGVVETVRIAPVHPNTQETATKNKVESKPNKFGAIVDDNLKEDVGRKEFAVQQHVPIQRGLESDEVVGFSKKTKAKNPWKTPVDLN